MTYVRAYTTWEDFPATTTPVTAAKLQGIEDGIANALNKTPSADADNLIQPVTGSDALSMRSADSVTYQLGTHYVAAAGSDTLRVDNYGNIIGGNDALIPPHPRANLQSAVPDFLYDSGLQRLGTRSFALAQIGDPADINFRVFGPSGGYPYGLTGNQVGSYTDLTGVEVNTAVGQLGCLPAVVPFNGDPETTSGAAADTFGGQFNWICAERPRDLTGDNSVAGMRGRFYATQNGAGSLDYVFEIAPKGSLLIGRTSIDVGTNGSHVQVWGDVGRNDVQRIIKSGTVSGGTFKLRHYGAPAASPKFGGAGSSPFPTLTGTVTTAASTAIVGAGTLFTSELAVGDWLRFGSDSKVYEVSAIADNTHLTLTATYTGTPAGGVAYVLAGDVTSALAYDISNDALQTALEALPGIGTGSNITGTVSVTNGSATVTGSGTDFLTDLRVGGYVRIGSDSASTLYNITAIASATSLTLSAVYAGSNGSGLACRSVSIAVTGGPVNTTTTTLTFTGALRHTLMVQMTPILSLTGGGAYSMVHQTEGRASGGASTLCYFRHGGPSGSVPSGDYYQWLTPAGAVVQKLTGAGTFNITGPFDHDGTTFGVFGVTPATQRAAYTQTYSTAARTVTTPPADITGGDAPTEAEFNALNQQVTALTKLANALIDDSQAFGFAT